MFLKQQWSLTRYVTVSFSYEFKPKKIKTENDKKAKKRKPEEVGGVTELQFQTHSETLVSEPFQKPE